MRARFFIAATITLVWGCSPEDRPLPKSTGAQGEVLVVMEKGHWEGPPGKLVRETLGAWMPRLPQREPRFDVAQVDPAGFGDLLRTHKDLLLARIGADSSGSWSMKDRYATDQVVVQVNDGTAAGWMERFRRMSNSICTGYEEHERARILSRERATQDATLAASIGEALGFSVVVPSGFRVIVQDRSMAWLQRDRIMSGAGLEHDVMEGLLLYQFPYTSDSTFTMEGMVQERDKLTRMYVNGPVPGSYMVVQRAFEHLDLRPETHHLELDGEYAYRMRGLWGMEGAKMGGAFVTICRVDSAQGRVICADGFVYAPQFDKREFVRTLEAICSSIQLVPTDPSDSIR
ncbi:MAG: DUF4837 family protein [Flavobacteriales bacterium]|nr:DUF4837 family protein [Flavobacteriales bacterium]